MSIKSVIDIDYDDLYREYVVNKKSQREMSVFFKVSTTSIKKLLKKNNITIRNPSTSKTKIIIKVGDIFGDLTVIKQLSCSKWKSQCKCGQTVISSAYHLYSRGCSCYKCGYKKISDNRKIYEDLSLQYFNYTCQKALARGLSFEISMEEIWDIYLKQNRKCALSGVEIKFDKLYGSLHSRKNKIQTASIDRKNSELGYSKENVQIIHKDLQRIKTNLDDSIFINWCHTISEYQKTIK